MPWFIFYYFFLHSSSSSSDGCGRAGAHYLDDVLHCTFAFHWRRCIGKRGDKHRTTNLTSNPPTKVKLKTTTTTTTKKKRRAVNDLTPIIITKRHVPSWCLSGACIILSRAFNDFYTVPFGMATTNVFWAIHGIYTEIVSCLLTNSHWMRHRRLTYTLPEI